MVKPIVLLVIVMVQIAVPSSVASTASCPEYTHPTCADNSVFNGYWWNRGWVPFYPSRESWFTPAPVWSLGNAVFYEPGPMAATAKWRNMSLAGYLGGVALMSPADIGQTVWLKPPEADWEGPYLVVDSATRGDIFPIIKFRREVIEIDYHTAQDWGMVTNSGDVLHWRLENVQVSKLPPHLLTGCPVNYPDWWLDRAKPAPKGEYIRTPLYRHPRSWDLNGWTTFTVPLKENLQQEIADYSDYLICE